MPKSDVKFGTFQRGVFKGTEQDGNFMKFLLAVNDSDGAYVERMDFKAHNVNTGQKTLPDDLVEGDVVEVLVYLRPFKYDKDGEEKLSIGRSALSVEVIK